ncbi:MAG: SMP-30/gluconolactonase/LRE family protein [Salaquimonas sp.]|nr:SMP-30/gluconolactonase/LRE family protein [Salaquimonas sp.]
MSIYEIFDPQFSALFNSNVHLDQLATGCRWSEGPAWFAAGRYLVWSDIPNNRMMRYDETDGSVSVFRSPSWNSNGNYVDREGRLLTCEHGTRRVTRTEHDGSITVIADNFGGKRFNSPNDVVVDSAGAIWFTDPTYGIKTDYEGDKAISEIGSANVYRVDPASGEVTAVATDFVQPNGLAFSPDHSRLYIADTGRTEGPEHPAHIRVFDVVDGRSLKGGAVFAECTRGLFDGFRLDEDGRIWTSTGEGVECYDADGTLLGLIRTPEVVANCVFGGPKRNRLFIAATTSLYAIYVMARGARP